jgi:hypothetical protein
MQSHHLLIADDHRLFRGALCEAVVGLIGRAEMAKVGWSVHVKFRQNGRPPSPLDLTQLFAAAGRPIHKVTHDAQVGSSADVRRSTDDVRFTPTHHERLPPHAHLLAVVFGLRPE